MIIDVKEYTYDTMPEYTDTVEGAKEVEMTGDEVGVTYIPDVVYDHKDGTDLHLQILQPSIFNHPEYTYPCIIYVRGSAWMKQNCYKDVVNLGKLAARGYVVAIVEYRHSGIAKFPATIIDGKNAVRYLKANAETYAINKDQCIIMGNSSGGHASSMIGMTSRTNLFDEPINDETLDLKGIIDLYGAVDVTMQYGFPTTLDHQLPTSPEGMYCGYNINEHLEEAKQVNSKTYASLDYPPMLIMHGTKDKTVFAQESVDLYNAVKDAGKDVTFYFVRHADHGGNVFWKDEILDIYDNFIKGCL